MNGFPPPYSLPWELHPLLPDGDGTGRTLPIALPPGRLVVSDRGAGQPAFWLSDSPADHLVWQRLLAEHDRTGFWPLLLGVDDEDDDDPWATGMVSFEGKSSPADHDPEAVLREWWYRYVVPSTVDTAPFGGEWPDGPAPAPPYRDNPGHSAEIFGGSLLYDYPMRLGLVAAGSADSVAALGWRGASAHTTDIARISAVLRDWERRYGTRVVAVTDDSLHLSVSAPPGTHDEARYVAAEHYAFCPRTWETTHALIDNEIVAVSEGVLAVYAETLIDQALWIFHWD